MTPQIATKGVKEFVICQRLERRVAPSYTRVARLNSLNERAARLERVAFMVEDLVAGA
jgi:hypothetical protein